MGRARRRRKRMYNRTLHERFFSFVRKIIYPRPYPKTLIIEKMIGETPLEAIKRLRNIYTLPPNLPLSYAGRLDPMASGKLLILVGDECKKQKTYHNLDKEYVVELLLGVSSDSGDILGKVNKGTTVLVSRTDVDRLFSRLRGTICLPYPIFSSKTVHGKPLHTWALEDKIHTINIPIKKSNIYKLQFNGIHTIDRDTLYETVRTKIETITPVTNPKKILGNDFRRDVVRAHWKNIATKHTQQYQVLSFTCIASSGTYMRSLCEHIAQALGTQGLALSIHRTRIGIYLNRARIWVKQYS